MYVSIIFILISAFWLLSEIILSRKRRSATKDSSRLDKSSLRFLWIAILLAVFLGVFLGLKGIGFIRVRHHFLSICGIFLMLLGLIIRWTAILSLRKYFTVDVSILPSHQIVKKGLYKYIRHPSYAGSLVSFLGLGLAFSNWLSSIVIVVPILTAYIYRMQVEEKALIQAFGDEYLDYSKTTKRLIPKIY
ncbi:MAG: isoprenylcysteine carboxylmethyltransferase family protein [candidate division Zixibacteria bacterium]|nr:isoprenylcysteine carboxylmethyltransferase family protein [candidate division Zixibacteria bacterium]